MSVSIQPPRCGPRRGRRPTAFSVTLTHGARDTTAGTVRIEYPARMAGDRGAAFRLTRENEREDFTFEVRPPASLPAGPVTLTRRRR